jgi:pimeloyl-ACP methyl ester carboxylesterase
MAADLAAGLEALGAREVLGIGHSMGGVLTLWATISHPHLFRAIVLVDPVILSPAQLRVFRERSTVGHGRRNPLVQRTLARRREWPNRQACFDYLKGKPLFASWPTAVLWDYVRYGTRVRDGDSVELIYPPNWEAHIFATAPTDIWRDVPRVRTRCLYVRGEQSETFTAETMDRIGRLLPSASLVTIPGVGHLLPMEAPEKVGTVIRRFFRGLPPV